MTASRTICLLLCLFSTGCGRVVFRPQDQQALSLSPDQQQTLAQQQAEFQDRASQLDRDNQELESLLAQSRQESQLKSEVIAATQDQLRATTDQLAGLQQEKTQLESRTQAMLASTQQRQPIVATIKANNTLLKPLKCGSLPGVSVKQDGDTIRVSVAADQVFAPNSTQLRPGGDQLLRNVATDLLANYPDQVIGIEGHTDSAPVVSPQHPSSHHLSASQATAVFDVLTRTARVPAQQLFVIGHGANHPIMSNATPDGQQANRRIDVVVYPESVRRR